MTFFKTKMLIGWILTISTTTFIVFVQHYQKPDSIVGGLYAAFGRTLWAFPISFIIVACSTGNGGNFFAIKIELIANIYISCRIHLQHLTRQISDPVKSYFICNLSTQSSCGHLSCHVE